MSLVLSAAAFVALKLAPARWRLPLAWVLVVVSMVVFSVEQS